ncbi:MAG: hypothetical protein VX589_01540 [Myxococcota bacterium]|nr:hypothetical protein [Myxococcota bacterium]
MKTIVSLFALSVFALGMIGCGGQQVAPLVEMDTMPEWAKNPKPTCGVGIVKYRGNLGLARTTAIARGRDELARSLVVKVEGLIKDYNAQGAENEKDFTEEDTTTVSRQLVDQMLVGTPVAEFTVSQDVPQQAYALVCMEAAAIGNAFDNMKRLSEKSRTALKARAFKEFADLDKQLNKKK